ncbi:YjjW family glycine radical enzyme activase, partial [Escherichia coli]
NAFHAHGVYGEAQSWASATPEDVEPLADALKVRGVSRLIFPALYL